MTTDAREGVTDVVEAEASSADGIETKPTYPPRAQAGTASIIVHDSPLPQATTAEAAKVLVEHLFAQNDVAIPGISYAVTYRLAEVQTGGDIVDVYHYDNGAVACSIADISGKGSRAAVNAALIKFGLRAYSSEGLTPERVIRAMDRLYLENTGFDGVESFASVFFGLIDPTRRMMTYSNAGHEPIVLVFPDGLTKVLNPTAPLIGVFDDQHHLFTQDFIDLPPGTLFVGATDGVTEARDADGDFYGMDRFVAAARAARTLPEADIVASIVSDVQAFSPYKQRDDIAIVAVRFH
jgi:serine phosphatase RsbU (regulator of sigma subunit)